MLTCEACGDRTKFVTMRQEIHTALCGPCYGDFKSYDRIMDQEHYNVNMANMGDYFND